MSVGRVVFSLDFELGWGHRQSRPAYVEQLRSYKGCLRDRIRELIVLFERYDIPATWAVVGRLIESGNDPLLHAPDLFESLLDSEPAHEIGLHSYAHKPYDNLSCAMAREDLTDGVKTLDEWNCRPESFVFPQNRVAHLDLLKEKGLLCYRGGSNKSRSFRSLFTPETFEQPNTESRPVRVPSSMFLASRRPSWYRKWHAQRGLGEAIECQKLIHYWLHPHNVVTDHSLIEELEALFEVIRSAYEDGDIQVQTISQAVGNRTV